MTMTKRRTKKYLAARIVCSMVLGAYLVGGYSSPVAWGVPVGDGAKIQGNSVNADGKESSAWVITQQRPRQSLPPGVITQQPRVKMPRPGEY